MSELKLPVIPLSAMTADIIPPELIELIIDALADCGQDSAAYKTLHDCLSVSRCVRDRARRHILSEVMLFDSREKFLDRMHLLRELLHSGPDSLPRFVKRFTLLRHYTVAAEDINNDGDLASILIKLCAEGAVENLEMDLCFGAIEWESIHPELQDSLYSLCHSPRLKAVQLRGFSGLPSTFFNGTSLNSIGLSNTLSGPAEEDPRSEPPPATLRSFQTDSLFTPPISWTSSPHGVSPFALLQCLTVSVKTPSHFAAACGICTAAFSSLEYLKLYLPSAPQNFDFDFSQLLSLKTLWLLQSGTGEFRPRHVNLDPTNICQLLHSPLPRTLQRIHIIFSEYYSYEMDKGPPIFHDSGWSPLDHLLSHPRFASIPLIGFEVTVLSALDIVEREQLLRFFVESLGNLLPNICATKQRNVLLEASSNVGFILRASQDCEFPDTITISRAEFPPCSEHSP